MHGTEVRHLLFPAEILGDQGFAALGTFARGRHLKLAVVGAGEGEKTGGGQVGRNQIVPADRADAGLVALDLGVQHAHVFRDFLRGSSQRREQYE